jgi:hypothetical protein
MDWPPFLFLAGIECCCHSEQEYMFQLLSKRRAARMLKRVQRKAVVFGHCKLCLLVLATTTVNDFASTRK